MTAPADPTPTTGGGHARLPALDVARGLAILGTLATNVWIFTDLQGLVGYLGGGTDADEVPAGWRAVELVAQQLAQGKFLGLLTLLFGVGLELQHRAAVRSGRPWPGRSWVRALLLLLDGALHFLLVAEFDVLMGYAVTALVVAAVLARGERSQRSWLIAAVAVHGVLLVLLTVALVLVPTTQGGAHLRPNPYADGSFADLVAFRLDNLALFRAEPVFIQALSVAMFLLGARLLRAGVLEERGAALRRRLLVLGTVALPVDLALGLLGGDAGLLLARYGSAPFVALGLLALVVEVVRRRPAPGAARRRLAEVGRSALSCYVLQNLLASALCYGWGLGVAARVGPGLRVPATVGVYVLVASVVVVAAHLWLRRHERGPLEALWRTSARRIAPDHAGKPASATDDDTHRARGRRAAVGQPGLAHRGRRGGRGRRGRRG